MLKKQANKSSKSEGIKWRRIGNFTKNAVKEFEKDIADKNK